LVSLNVQLFIVDLSWDISTKVVRKSWYYHHIIITLTILNHLITNIYIYFRIINLEVSFCIVLIEITVAITYAISMTEARTPISRKENLIKILVPYRWLKTSMNSLDLIPRTHRFGRYNLRLTNSHTARGFRSETSLRNKPFSSFATNSDLKCEHSVNTNYNPHRKKNVSHHCYRPL
jgi:hypothetical protein